MLAAGCQESERKDSTDGPTPSNPDSSQHQQYLDWSVGHVDAERRPAYSYINNVQLLGDTIEKSYDIIGEHLADFPDEANVRRSAYGTTELRALSLEEMERYLPNELFQHRRAVSARDGGESLTLEQELDQLAEEYKKQLIENAPDTALAATLDNVEEIEGGLIVDGDRFLDPTTMQGAFEIEMLNAVAQGADVERALDALKEFNTEFEFEDGELDGNDSRYIYKTNLRKWPGGEIVYHYGYLTSAHKSALRTAMDEWEAKTGGAVTFKRYADKSGWYKFKAKLGLRGMVTYESTAILNNQTPGAYTGVAGWSRTGSYGYDRVLMNKDKGWSEYDDLLRTARHELGHVIGLKHEHQHWDRDKWVVIPDSGILNYALNYQKIDQYKHVIKTKWSWRRVRVKRGWFRFTIWRPTLVAWTDKVTNAYSGGFDCDSIMLYALEAKRDCGSHNQGDYTANSEISRGDVAGAQSIY